MSKKPENSAQKPGNTATVNIKGGAQPRLPHEHDESADSQRSKPTEVMKQALKDVESGQENTDLRGSQGRREPSVPASDENPAKP